MRIFVTTCPEMWRVERALLYSIRKYCPGDPEVTFLRSGDPGWRTNVDEGLPHADRKAIKQQGCWNVGRDHPRPMSGDGWATPFSCFRFAIPELCGFSGRAIHMDADFVVLRDLDEVWRHAMTHPIHSPHRRTDLMLIDCGAFKDQTWWPSIDEMRPSGLKIEDFYKSMLSHHNFIADAPRHWESWDGQGMTFELDDPTLTLHFTKMKTQPWKPMPEYFKYPPHPCPAAALRFWELYAESCEQRESCVA